MGIGGSPSRKRKAYDWVTPGAPCWYQPALESRPFAATVGSELFDSGGDLCVKLVDLDERYVKRTGRNWISRVPWYVLRERRVK